MATSFESRMDKLAALNPNPGLASVPASEPRRVCERRARPAQRRRRCDDVPAARHDQPRLRQRRRLAELFADADGRLPARGQPDQPARGRRSQRLGLVGDLQDPARGVADAPRRRRADGHARRHVGRAHVPGRWPLRAEGVAALRAARRPGRPQLDDRVRPQGAGRVLGQRRARRDLRSQHAHERDRSEEQPRAGDAAGAHQGRPAARHRGVRAEARRPGRRPADAAREHARRRQHHLGRDDAAAPARLHRAGPARRHRRVGHAEPPEDLLVPADREGRRGSRARPRSSRSCRRRRSAARRPRPICRTR